MDAQYRELRLSYQDYVKMGSSLENCQVDRYYIYQKIGEGQYGSVFIGMDDITKNVVAFKLLDLTLIDQERSEKVRQIRRRLSITQPQLMMKCKSDNIVKCFTVYQNQWLKLMVIEYCNGPTLQKQIDDKTRIPQQKAISILRQLINAIAEMHRQGIIHRDLKADNILSHNGFYKVADLGFSKQMDDPNNELQQTTLGTITTMAPEVLQRKPYGVKADVWSLGVVFFQMIFGALPYDSKTAAKICEEIRTKKILNTDRFTYNGYTASKAVTTFLRDVMKVDPRDRLDWKALLKHPIFDAHDRLEEQFLIKSVFIPEEQNNGSLEEYDQRRMEEQLIRQSTRMAAQGGRGNDVRLVRGQETMIRKEEINRLTDAQMELNRWVHECHLQCLKTQLIFCQLVEKIIQNELLDLSDRDVVEMLFCMLTRALNNMSPINAKLKETGGQRLLLNFRETVTRLHTRVTATWQQYSQKLTAAQNKMTSIIFDGLCKVFSSEALKKKDLFLTGLENIEYSKHAQIEFTYSYIKQMMDKLVSAQGTNLNYIRKLMTHYVDINLVTFDQLEASGRTLNQYIEERIFKQ